MEYPTKQGKAFSTPRVAAILLVGAVLIAGEQFLLSRAGALAPKPVMAKPVAATPATPPADPFAPEIAQLVGPPRHEASTSEQILLARGAIARGDFPLAEQTIRSVLQRSRVEDWHFAPFAAFASGIAPAQDTAFLQRLNEWIAHDPSSATPRLLRAEYYLGTGWSIRGTRFASEIAAGHLDQFSNDLDKAGRDVAAAIRLDPADPYLAFLQLEILAGNGNSPELDLAFRHSIQRFPHYYALYEMRLSSLQPKWGGSVRALYAFVDRYAGAAPRYAPIRMLYLQLYADLVNVAAIECTEGDKIPSSCVNQALNTLTTDALNQNVDRLFHLYGHVDTAQFSLEVGSILGQIIETEGADRPAAALLQIAAQAMGSDNALVATDTGGNNFMMDALTGRVWYRAGQYDNAETLYRRAITDLPHVHFASLEQRDLTLGGLYDDLAETYNRKHDYHQVIVYQRAADALGNHGDGDLTCAALFNLKQYAAAIKTCSTLAGASDLEALYWRGHAYQASGQPDLALADYRRIADSENYLRRYAAIDLSVIYGQKHDMPDMLKVLNTYQYLYDPALVDRETVAIAYNNRCYAKMQMGKLAEALQDCTASLQFGNLPDAYAKQQQLLQRLKGRPGALPAPPVLPKTSPNRSSARVTLAPARSAAA